ncbi:DUF2867 domain-containing protein [Agromyces bauzanensis]
MPAPSTSPAFWSLAFAEIADPDYADVAVGVLPAHATADPAAWARSLFSLRSLPLWLIALVGMRQALAPIVGLPRVPRDRFRVHYVVGDEALLAVDDRHLDVRVGVGVDEEHGIVRVVTAVRMKGWRGRLFMVPVRMVHPHLVNAMISRSRRNLSGVTA